MRFAEELERVYEALELPPTGFEKLVHHYELLVRWNRKINLTRIIEPDEAAWRHFAESLFILKHVDPGKTVDIGSGGGFPGLPLAAHGFPVTALEPVAKKANFLREVSRDWPNVTIDERRLEDVRGDYDLAVSRAVKLTEPDLARVARAAALLVSAGTELPGESFDWDEPIPMPWAEERVLLVGKRCSTWNI